MGYGTLRVTTPDGQVREYPIEQETVVVGRAEGNGVVIDHVSVSRRHAQLYLHDGKVTVEDLGSANGTFVGSQRLAVNTPAQVVEGQPIRFGDVEARFFVPIEDGGSGPTTLGGAGAGSAAGAADAQATFSVSLSSPPAPVAAGATTTATVVIQNRGARLDQFTISVVDVPAGWVRISRQQVSLVSAARDEVTIAIQPPRSSEAGAGEYAFAVSVVSRETGREVRVLGKFSILPFDGLAMVVEQRGPRSFWVIVSNTGNAPAAYTFAAADEKESLDFAFDQDAVELPGGDRQTIGLRATPKKRSLFGSVEARPFRVQARPRGGGTQQATADGQIVIRPPLRFWRWVAAALLAVVIGIAAYFALRNVDFSNDDDGPIITATVGAEPTEAVAGTTTPPPAPQTGLAVGVQAVVAQSECTAADALRVRGEAGTDKPIRTAICNGARVDVLEGPVQANELTWWRIRVIQGDPVPSFSPPVNIEGWAAQGAGGRTYLERAP